jgi:hypothetical protein
MKVVLRGDSDLRGDSATEEDDPVLSCNSAAEEDDPDFVLIRQRKKMVLI